jgi:CheY-like chemotaxis protein
VPKTTATRDRRGQRDPAALRDAIAANLARDVRLEDRLRTLREGFRLHLAKPVALTELVASLAGRGVGTGEAREG